MIVDDCGEYVVAWKEHGELAHGSVDPRRPHFLGRISALLGESLFLVHRLDVPTAGLVVLARTQESCAHLQRIWQGPGVRKIYEAWIEGGPLAECPALWKDFLRVEKHSGREKTVPVRSGGQVAMTHLLQQRVMGEGTQLRLELGTGRKHQLRAQCALRGHPIRGDVEYGARPWAQAGIALTCIEIHIDYLGTGEARVHTRG